MAGLDYNLVVKGYKPRLTQTSSMYNFNSKVRGVQFIQNHDSEIVFTCDSLGGLYASVGQLDHAKRINQVGSRVMNQEDIIKTMRREYAKEDN